MKELLVFCGIPGSGKSSHARNVVAKDKNFIHVSRDEIRFAILDAEGGDYFSHEDEVLKQFYSKIKKGLDEGKSVIADATHLTQRGRTNLLRNLGSSLKDCEVSAINFEIPLSVCLERNEQRAGTRAYVPPEVIVKMAKSKVRPQHEEGFDYTYTIKL
jgi:predicted kinase